MFIEITGETFCDIYKRLVENKPIKLDLYYDEALKIMEKVGLSFTTTKKENGILMFVYHVINEKLFMKSVIKYDIPYKIVKRF